MRVFLANASNPEYQKDSRYNLSSFVDGERACLKKMEYCKRDNFLLDSGTYSFLKGKECTKEIINQHIKKYIAFINANKIPYFFELDVDNIFGVEYVKELTAFLEKETKAQCIPVWHKIRGIDEWKRLVSEYKYIAIGGFASKHIKPQEYDNIKKLVAYAKWNGCKVHGLGFTKTKEMQGWDFYSVDSSSFSLAMANGTRHDFVNGVIESHVVSKTIKADYDKLAWHNVCEWIKYQEYMDKKGW